MRCVILAAGLGSRFKSEKPKVLHTILGKPMIWHVLQVVKNSGIKDIGVVVGHKADEVIEVLKDEGVVFFHQKDPKGGTADALLSSASMWRSSEDYLLIINGDSPLVKSQTIKNMERFLHMVSEYESIKLSGVLLTSFLPDPTGYGRVIEDGMGNIVKVVEEKDANFEEKNIKKINSGVYIFYAPHLIESLFAIKPSEASGELYITETFKVMYNKGYKVRSFMAEDITEAMGVNTRWDLAIAENIIRLRILQHWAEKGNTLHQPESIWIEPDVILEGDVEIHPSVTLKGKTRIGKNSVLGRGCYIEHSTIGNNVIVEPFSLIKDSEIGDNAHLGPFVHIRNGSFIGEASQINNFVEVKASQIGKDVKAKHLAYIGDAHVEDQTNIGAGVVFANFDGKRKYKSYVGKHAFIGSNSLLIAPIKIGNYAYIAGGSVIDEDIEDGDLAISRPKLKAIKGKGKDRLID
ncbi:MAG: bifunctional UDP-N-acetylglucosamine diphosphorylase/glucosamine-1-phosphate N-acetyltransferase GlmU [Aquificaceae bacterium]